MLKASENLLESLALERVAYDNEQARQEAIRLQEELDNYICDEWVSFAQSVATRHLTPDEASMEKDELITPFTTERDKNFYSGWTSVASQGAENGSVLQANIQYTCSEANPSSIQPIAQRITVLLRLSDPQREGCYTRSERAILIICPQNTPDQKQVQGDVILNPDDLEKTIHPAPTDGLKNEWEALQGSLNQLRAAHFPGAFAADISQA